MSKRLLRAIERAHFSSVLDELGRETLTYCREDELFDEDVMWSFSALLNQEPAGGWVN